MALNPAAKPASTEPAPGLNGASAESVQPDYVTKTEYDALIQRLDNQSRVLGKLESSIRKDDAPKPKAEEDKTLTERIRAMEEKEQKQKQKAARLEIKAALTTAGAQPEGIEGFAKMLYSEYQPAIEVDDEDRVLITEAEGKKAPVGEWVRAFLQSDKGKWMMAPKAAPVDKSSARSMPSKSSSSGDVMKISKDDYRHDPMKYTRMLQEGKKWEFDD
jgi:hypothetical protein